MEEEGGCWTLFRLVGGVFRGPDPLHEAVPRSRCTAGKEEGKGEDAFFGDFLLDWIGENVSPQIGREPNTTRTPTRGKSHDNDVSKNTEGYNPRHDSWSNVVVENFAEEHSRHVEVFVQSLILRYSAQLSYGQPCPKEAVIALTYAILTSMNKTMTNT